MKNGGLKEIKQDWHGNLSAYLIGFVLSLVLTGISFFLVMSEQFDKNKIVYYIIGLAFLQAAAQVIFFLHVAKESKPFWETKAFFFMLLVLVIIVLGSLWIMFDLNYRVMPGM